MASERLFTYVDQDRDGRVTGKDCVVFFEKSGLPREVLAKVWDLSNTARAGYLDRAGFGRAMELIAIAQQGMEVNPVNYQYAQEHGPIPPPKLAGFTEDCMPEDPKVLAAMGAAQSQLQKNHSFMSPSSYQPDHSRWGKDQGPRKKPVSGKVCTSIVDGLKALYFNKIRPLEHEFKFGHFFSPLLSESDFEAKPSVLLLGQYSTGKTTFIKHLLGGMAYPGCHIGPEPTTDRFVVVYHGLEERRVPGNTLAVSPDKPFQGLQAFGTGFLSRFEGSQCPARLLEEITIVDTPGVLSGEKQRIERNYNFVEIAQWFAARCDLIFLLFDPAKLDISDEFKQVISALRGHDDKVRIILNKADQVDQQQLMRVYGALMFSLGRVFKTPEVCRVYVGSFNSDAPISAEKNPHGVSLFEAEQRELLQSLYDIPQRSCDRKINEFVKRVRALKIHLLLIGHLRKAMPAMFGQEKAQKKLLAKLPEAFTQVMREHHLPAGDFPSVDRFHEILSAFPLQDFPKLSSSMIKQVDSVLSQDIPALVKDFGNPYENP